MMKTKITLATGKLAHVEFTASEEPSKKARHWHGHYLVETYKRTDDQILAEIDRLREHHSKKVECLNRFETLVGSPVVVGGTSFVWYDCTISERGTGVELYLDLIDPAGKVAEGMPLRLPYPSCAEIPSNSEIVAIVERVIEVHMTAAAEHQAKLARVQAALQGGVR